MSATAKHPLLAIAAACAALLLGGVGCSAPSVDAVAIPQRIGAASNIDPPGGPDKPRRRPGEQAAPVAIPREEVVVPMEAVGSSRIAGDALLVTDGYRTRFSLRMDGTTQGVDLPVVVRTGTCDEPGAVKFPLASLVGGLSSSIVNGTISDILNETPLVIVVPKSDAEPEELLACGGIKREGRKPLNEADRVAARTPPEVIGAPYVTAPALTPTPPAPKPTTPTPPPYPSVTAH